MSRELVRRAQGGDREAFGELARLYAPLVTGAVLSRVGRFQDAEDLVQETFLRALRQIGSLKDPDRAGAWLYGIAVNVAREHRRAHPASAALPAEVPKPRPEGGPSVDADTLRGCLERLPEGLREIFILRHIKNLSYRELGQVRNITVSSVGERLWTARRLLRHCLERRGGLGLSEA